MRVVCGFCSKATDSRSWSQRVLSIQSLHLMLMASRSLASENRVFMVFQFVSPSSVTRPWHPGSAGDRLPDSWNQD